MSDVLTAEELLAGGSMTHKIEVPEKVLYPKASEGKVESQPVKHIEKKNRTVVLRPLTISQIALVTKASKDDTIEIKGTPNPKINDVPFQVRSVKHWLSKSEGFTSVIGWSRIVD